MTPEQIERFVRRRENELHRNIGGYPADIRAFGEYLIVAETDHNDEPFLSIYLLCDIEEDILRAITLRHEFEGIGYSWRETREAEEIREPVATVIEGGL